jgi:pyruvate,water dikinase
MGVVTTARHPDRVGPPRPAPSTRARVPAAPGTEAEPPAGTSPAAEPGAALGTDPVVIAWDNANIVESFPELTLPLTFSVAVELYASVYRGACRALGVPRRTLHREDRVFEQMLGLLQGRVYYNLDSWYRVLSLLPGFRLTAGFLEAMMGARRPGAGAGERATPVAAGAVRRVELATMTARLAYRLLRFGSDATRFRARIAALLAASSRSRRNPARQASPQDLLAEFEGLSAAALSDWRAPIMNDLFLMLAHGALQRVAGRWLGTEAPSLVNAVLVGGGVESARAGEDLLGVARRIRADPAWRVLVVESDPEIVVARIRTDPALGGLATLFDGYLADWGDRAPRELQLERPTYRDAPAALLRALRPLVAANTAPHGGRAATARRRVRRRLLAHPLGIARLAVFELLVTATRRHIRWREDMRLARGRIFGVARLIFRDLGAVLRDAGVLGDPEDIHYLSIAEVRGLIRGTSAPDDPRDVVRRRRARYAEYAALPGLPSRFETRGPITDPLAIAPSSAPGGAVAGAPEADSLVWHGIGASVGRVRGRCVVVLEPTLAEPPAGRVIVARSTDPGWVPLLAGAAGLVVEQGSLLSHSAIVARELGLPAVVRLPGLLDRVHDGDILELDGSTGEVRLERALAVAR